MQAEYDLQQNIGERVHASGLNKFKESETHQEEMWKNLFSSYMMTVGSDAVRTVSSYCWRKKETAVLLFTALAKKEQRKEVGGEWGHNDRGRWIG